MRKSPAARRSRSCATFPETPDLVIVVAPKEKVAGIVNEAADISVPAVIVMTDDPTPGADSLFEQLRAIARQRDIRIFGPNCHGLDRAARQAERQPVGPARAAGRPRGDFAIGGGDGRDRRLGAIRVRSVFPAWPRWATWPMSTIDDLLDFYALDPMTRAILLYVETLEDAKGFMSAARAASRVKPVIVVRSGRHEASRRAGTHAGNLATTDDVYDAAFRRAGLLRVPDIDALFDAAEALGRVKPFNGERLAIVTNGRGVGYLAIDQLLDLGGKLAGYFAGDARGAASRCCRRPGAARRRWNWPATPAPPITARRCRCCCRTAPMTRSSPCIRRMCSSIARRSPRRRWRR